MRFARGSFRGVARFTLDTLEHSGKIPGEMGVYRRFV